MIEMDSRTYTGKIEWFKTKLGEKLLINQQPKPDTPDKPATLCPSIVGIFEEYLNKKIKITIEVIEE